VDNIAAEYLQKLNADLVSQFRRQPNITGFMSTVAKQLQDVHGAHEQLNTMRWLQNAEGKQLDGIGAIVVMSRADAALFEIGKPDASAVNDTVYRKYLYYKMFLNTSTGTRREVMKALRFFWDEAPLYYSENPDYPATIFVSTPPLAPDVPIEGLLEAPIVKPAGVRFIIQINTRTYNDLQIIRHIGLSVVKVTVTQVLEVAHEGVSRQFRHKSSPLWKITDHDMPPTIPQAITERLRPVNAPQWKVTQTNTEEVDIPVTAKRMRQAYAPQWTISRTATGEFEAVAVEKEQRYRELGTVKITNTPLAAYGGE
jgi:hypothetical protein